MDERMMKTEGGGRRSLTCLSNDSMIASFCRICARRYSRLLYSKTSFAFALIEVVVDGVVVVVVVEVGVGIEEEEQVHGHPHIRVVVVIGGVEVEVETGKAVMTAEG